MNKNIARKTANLLFDINAISISLKKPFRFTTGILSPIYIDNRMTISYPKVRKQINYFYIKIIMEKIGLDNIDVISGTATAAIPYAAFIAQELNLPMIYVRKDKKGYGKQNKIEGIMKKGEKVLVIEDHISTGSNLMGNVKAVRQRGGKVQYAVGTTTYLMKIADKIFKKEKIKLFTFTDLNWIINVAIEKKLIKPAERKIILEWAKNPKKWGKKFGFE